MLLYHQIIGIIIVKIFFNYIFFNSKAQPKTIHLDYISLGKSDKNSYNNSEGQIYGPNERFKLNSELYFSNPANYLDTYDTYLKIKLTNIRNLLIDWINRDIISEKEIPINTQENILHEINKLLKNN